MNVNLITTLSSLGYGVAGINIAEQLIAQGHEVALFPIGNTEIPHSKRAVLQKAIAMNKAYDDKAPSLRIYHQDQQAEHVGRGKRVGFPFFELDRFAYGERHHLERLDALCVATDWARIVCEGQGIGVPIHVVPLGVDRTIFHEGLIDSLPVVDHTIFVNVGKWEKRKGHDLLLRAFNRAFEPTDKVILRMMPMLPYPWLERVNAAWCQEYLASRMGAHGKIELRPRSQSQSEVAKLLAGADCCVFPARAEGWNLELLEAMSCGVHCVATDYSGHTAFANNENCRLIPIDSFEEADDGVWFHGGGEWASLGPPQEDLLVDHMREIHRLKQRGELCRNTKGIETSKSFSWSETALRLTSVLE